MPTSWKVENVVKCQEEHKNKIPEKKNYPHSLHLKLHEKNGKCELWLQRPTFLKLQKIL